MSILLGLRRVDDLLEHLPDDDAWMGAQERERLARITHPQRRAQYRAGHGYARDLLARFGGGEPSQWGLERDERGTPLALRNGKASGLHVSLSHSGGFIACAVAGQAVGVDIECQMRERDLLTLAGSLYPEDFVRELAQCDAAVRKAKFFRRWTLDEAHGKADGRGLRMHALKTQAWQVAPQDVADGWTWGMPGGWLAVAVCGHVGPQDFAIEGDVTVATKQAWRRRAA